jgi:hypothetical protein
MEHELNPSKIVGECSKCGHLYDICRNGLCCDVCGGIAIRGARWADTQGPVIDFDFGTAQEVTWLDKLYALDNEGSTR